jgi:hypothetical protein
MNLLAVALPQVERIHEVASIPNSAEFNTETVTVRVQFVVLFLSSEAGSAEP